MPWLRLFPLTLATPLPRPSLRPAGTFLSVSLLPKASAMPRHEPAKAGHVLAPVMKSGFRLKNPDFD
jgi:hypothetical protein